MERKIKITIEVNEMDPKRLIQGINGTKNWSLEKDKQDEQNLNQNNKKKVRQKTQI
jgi:hypothetical protein